MKLQIIEGHDGTGKTTFSHRLLDYYLGEGLRAERLKFPTSYPSDELLSRPTDLMLYYLNDFREALSAYRGRSDVDILVVDRSFISTMVYQGFREVEGVDTLDENALRTIAVLGSRLFTEGLDLDTVEIVFMECHLTEAMSRIIDRDAEVKDSLERMPLEEMTHKVRTLKDRYTLVKNIFAYDWYSPLQPGGNAIEGARVLTIDTTRMNPEEVVLFYVSVIEGCERGVWS